MSSGEAGRGELLLAEARAALAEAVGAAPPSPRHYRDQPWLHEPGATFVTLRREGELRGCIGTLEPRRTLLEDVRENARGAAVADHRFPPVAREELGELAVEVSVISELEELAFGGEAELVEALRPGVDGVVLECGERRGTFLPQVWEHFPRPADFLEQLKLKAGLTPVFWSDEMRAWRYSVESYG